MAFYLSRESLAGKEYRRQETGDRKELSEIPTYPTQVLQELLWVWPSPKRNCWFKLFQKYLQTGLRHSSNNKLGNQDITMMNSQTINEAKRQNESRQKSYFMPSLADVGIVTLRKWLDEFADSKPK